MNYNKCVYLIMSFLIVLTSPRGCIYEQECKSDYDRAVRVLEIGPFEYVNASFAEILNDLFVSSNNELAKHGYERTIGIVVGGISATQDSRLLSVLMPRQTICSTMVQLAEIVGTDVKFEQGLFRFCGSVDGDKDEVDCKEVYDMEGEDDESSDFL